MAASFPDRRARAHSHRARVWATAIGLLLASALPAADPPRRSTDAVSLDAASSDVDYKTNTVVFRDVVVSQGGIRVSAEQARATGLNFNNSMWTFSGRVRIVVDGGMLSSDQARVDFSDNRILRATIVGNPAQFEQPRVGTSDIARGRAGSIEYNVQGGIVTLSRDAWLTDGRNEISGQRLVYNVREQRVQAQSAPGRKDRVQITIRPRDAAAGTPSPGKPSP